METKFFWIMSLLLFLLLSEEVVQIHASLCYAGSKTHKGMCLLGHNCAACCVSEGFTHGSCTRFRRRCVCSKNCDDQPGGGGSPGGEYPHYEGPSAPEFGPRADSAYEEEGKEPDPDKPFEEEHHHHDKAPAAAPSAEGPEGASPPSEEALGLDVEWDDLKLRRAFNKISK